MTIPFSIGEGTTGGWPGYVETQRTNIVGAVGSAGGSPSLGAKSHTTLVSGLGFCLGYYLLYCLKHSSMNLIRAWKP